MTLAANAKPCTVVRGRTSPAGPFTNTPELEPSFADSDSDSDSSDCEEDHESIQYVFIPSDSAFHRRTSTPRTSAYSPFSGFPFACYALAEGTPLFSQTPDAFFDEEPQRITHTSGDGVDDAVIVVDESSSGMDGHISLDWMSAAVNDAQYFAEQAKPASMIFDDDALRQYL